MQAQGEVAALKDTINEMIRNLRDTTQKNTEQDWLKTNLAKFSRMLQGQKDLNTVGRLILSELAPVVTAQHAEFYVLSTAADDVPAPHAARELRLAKGESAHGTRIGLGEGLVGQCALEQAQDPPHQRAAGLPAHRLGPRQRAAAATSSCCRWCSKAR